MGIREIRAEVKAFNDWLDTKTEKELDALERFFDSSHNGDCTNS